MLFGADALSHLRSRAIHALSQVPPGWDGRPCGAMRTTRFGFTCVGPCGRVCAAKRDVAGPGAWQRMCRACCLRLRARALWAKARRAHYVARVLARGLLRAYVRATERVYAPGGIGYVRARDDFEERAHKQQRV